MRRLRRIAAVVFAGDIRVWRAAAVMAVPLLAVIAYCCLRPREYFTGTNSVEAQTYIAEVSTGEAMCVPGLQVPAGTARIRLLLVSPTRTRPGLRMDLKLGVGADQSNTGAGAGIRTSTEARTSAVGSGTGTRTIVSSLGPIKVPANRISGAEFTIPTLPGRPAERPASICLTASGRVNWGGTPLVAPPSLAAPTVGGRPVSGRIAVWYLPPVGSQRSYLSHLGEIFDRASLFRPSPIGPWTYVLIIFVLLPGLALVSVHRLALAVAGAGSARRTAAWLFAIAALNFACWALITPPFQAPDEVDHFAYTQSLVQRGEAPSRNAASALPRWSSAEELALEDESFFTDHQVGDTKAPWTTRQADFYKTEVRTEHPSSSNGGGNETAATHGAVYYATLAPAYWLASSSPFSQLTLMRLTSALIGALTVVFAYLMARELAPGRPWLGVLAALLIAYQPMYGFISGAVNNDVGVNAGVAALELLVIMMLRRGVTWRLGLITGALLIVLPIVKATAYSVYPVAALAALAILWRHHRRSQIAGWATLGVTALAMHELTRHLSTVFRGSETGSGGAPVGVGSATSAVSEAAAHPIGYLGYLWEALLPRLPFMTRHFETTNFAGFAIFVERGWGAFGWYDVLFPQRWYYVILAAMILVPILGLIAIVREWPFVRAHWIELAILILMPLAVFAGFEAAFYTPGARTVIAEFGRYEFPAIVPLAVLVVASLHAFGRRFIVFVGAGLLVAMIALSFSGQLLTLTGFYA
jgi:hypothetical protein